MAVPHVVIFYDIWSHLSQTLVFLLATGVLLVSRLYRLHVESGGPPLSLQRGMQFMYIIRPSWQHSPIALWLRYIIYSSQQVFAERGAFHPVGIRRDERSQHFVIRLQHVPNRHSHVPPWRFLRPVCGTESPEYKAMRLVLRITRHSAKLLSTLSGTYTGLY